MKKIILIMLFFLTAYCSIGQNIVNGGFVRARDSAKIEGTLMLTGIPEAKKPKQLYYDPITMQVSFGDSTAGGNSFLSSNGTAVISGNMGLGQPVGQAGNPAALIQDREIPLGAYNLSFFSTGGFTLIDSLKLLGIYNMRRLLNNLTGGNDSLTLVCGIVRPSWTNSNNGNTINWNILTIADGHGSINVTNVYAPSPTQLRITFPVAVQVLTLNINVDETFASRGMTCGPSVAMNYADIQMFVPANKSAVITGNGSGWSGDGSVSWSGNVTSVNNLFGNTDASVYNTNLVYSGDSSFYFKPQSSGIGLNQMKFRMYRTTDGTEVTRAPNSSDKAFVMKPNVPMYVGTQAFSGSGMERIVFTTSAIASASAGSSTGNLFFAGWLKR